MEVNPWQPGSNEKHHEDQFLSQPGPESDFSYLPHGEDALSTGSYLKDDVVLGTGAQTLPSNNVAEDASYLTQTLNELTPAVSLSNTSTGEQQAPSSWTQPKPASPSLTPLPYSLFQRILKMQAPISHKTSPIARLSLKAHLPQSTVQKKNSFQSETCMILTPRKQCIIPIIIFPGHHPHCHSITDAKMSLKSLLAI